MLEKIDLTRKLPKEEYKTTTISTLYTYFFIRIIALQTAILVGGIIIDLMDSPMLFMGILVVVKTGFEILYLLNSNGIKSELTDTITDRAD